MLSRQTARQEETGMERSFRLFQEKFTNAQRRQRLTRMSVWLKLCRIGQVLLLALGLLALSPPAESSAKEAGKSTRKPATTPAPVQEAAAPARALEEPRASVALINFTPRNMDPDVVATFSRNLRESFLLESKVQMFEEREMYMVLAGGPEGQARLRQARGLLADAKRGFKEGDFESVLAKLNEARSLHRAAFSELSRPAELADVFFYQGLTQLRLARPDAAQMSFLQMYLLVPDFVPSAGLTLSAEDQETLEAAQRLERSTPLRGISSNFAADIAKRLDVLQLLVGLVEAQAPEAGGGAVVKVVVRSVEQNEPVATLVFELEELAQGAPPVGSPVYKRIVNVCQRYLTPR